MSQRPEGSAIARKYVNPNRRPADADEQWRDYVRELVEQVHGPELAAELEAMSAGRARAGHPGGYSRHVRFERGGMSVLNLMNRYQPGPAAPEPAPPTAALDKFPFAKNFGTFLAAVRANDQTLARESAKIRAAAGGMDERVPSDGGFLLPWSLSQKVFAYLTEAVVYPRAMVLPMSTYRLALPVLENTSQASGAQGLGGATFSVVTDGKSIPASNFKFGRTMLDAVKLAALVTPVPDELADDAAEAFSDLFGRIVGMGLAWELDDLFFNGTGVNGPEGVLNSPAALAVTRTSSGNAPVHSDVVAMLQAAHPASLKRLLWAMSSDVFESLLELYEVVGTAPAGQDVPPPNTLRFNTQTGTWELLGVPCEITDHQPVAGADGDLALLDLSVYAVGSRELMTIERSSKGSTFILGASSYRIRTRIDGRSIPRQTYTLANGKVRSPLVVLH